MENPKASTRGSGCWSSLRYTAYLVVQKKHIYIHIYIYIRRDIDYYGIYIYMYVCVNIYIYTYTTTIVIWKYILDSFKLITSEQKFPIHRLCSKRPPPSAQRRTPRIGGTTAPHPTWTLTNKGLEDSFLEVILRVEIWRRV
jgi:hypothetical protein